MTNNEFSGTCPCIKAYTTMYDQQKSISGSNYDRNKTRSCFSYATKHMIVYGPYMLVYNILEIKIKHDQS